MGSRAAVLNAKGELFSNSVQWDLPEGEWHLTVTDLAPGKWQLENGSQSVTVEEGKNIAILNVNGGKNALKRSAL